MLSWNLTEIRLQGEMIRVVLLVAERWENIKFDILFPLWFMATKTAKDIKEASKQKNLICLMFDLRNFFSVTSRFNCQWHIAEVLFFTLIELFIFNKSIAFALALWMLLKCHKNRLDVVDFFVLRNKIGFNYEENFVQRMSSELYFDNPLRNNNVKMLFHCNVTRHKPKYGDDAAEGKN